MFERRNGFVFVFVEGGVNNMVVFEVDFVVGFLLGEGVFYLVFVVMVGVVFVGVGVMRFFVVGGGGGGLDIVELIVSLCFFFVLIF